MNLVCLSISLVFLFKKMALCTNQLEPSILFSYWGGDTFLLAGVAWRGRHCGIVR